MPIDTRPNDGGKGHLRMCARIVGDIHSSAIGREGGTDIADGFPAIGIAGPEELAGLAIHSLHSFGPMVATYDQVCAVWASPIEEDHAAAAHAAVSRRTWRAFLPADGVEKCSIQTIGGNCEIS